MSATEVRSHDAPSYANVGKMAMKLEVVVIAVADVDRAKEFYGGLGWRIDAEETAFASPVDLASALRRASAAHGEHERRIGKADPEGWPDWYAAYMVAEQAGVELPT